MPRFDGTDPKGQGNMTGRGLGYCVSEYSSHSNNSRSIFNGLGQNQMGLGMGRRQGKGLCRNSYINHTLGCPNIEEVNFFKGKLKY